jgi:hypothetical protein
LSTELRRVAPFAWLPCQGDQMTRHWLAVRRAGMGLAALALISGSLAACGGSSATPVATAAPTAAATPTPTPTPAPTPTPTPALVDVVKATLTSTTFQASGTSSGSFGFTVGTTKYDGTWTGTFKIKGKDSASITAINITNVTTTNEQVTVGDYDYSRINGGAWTKKARSAGMDTADMVAGGMADKGVETHNGQQLHRLEPTVAPSAKTLFADAAMATGQFTVTFWVKDDGRLVAMVIAGTWNQDLGGTMAVAQVNIEYKFEGLTGVTIEAPAV